MISPLTEESGRVLTFIKARRLFIKAINLIQSIKSVHLDNLVPALAKLNGGIPLPSYSNKSLFKLKLDLVSILLANKSFILQVGFIISTWKNLK